MGNLNNNTEYYKYNKWVDPANHFGKDTTGPIIHPKIKDYSKEIEFFFYSYWRCWYDIPSLWKRN